MRVVDLLALQVMSWSSAETHALLFLPLGPPRPSPSAQPWPSPATPGAGEEPGADADALTEHTWPTCRQGGGGCPPTPRAGDA